ncbi:MAG: hypothetical protein OXG55_16570 [bacterium]|nr:hypothetical protein [bacterium]MCY4104851.1 hypothetical protein [bacterium]
MERLPELHLEFGPAGAAAGLLLCTVLLVEPSSDEVLASGEHLALGGQALPVAGERELLLRRLDAEGLLTRSGETEMAAVRLVWGSSPS